MKRSWTALAVALSAIFAAIGCNDYGNTFQVPTGATITSLSPANITAGSPQFTLTVVGGVFVAKTVVQWNGGTISGVFHIAELYCGGRRGVHSDRYRHQFRDERGSDASFPGPVGRAWNADDAGDG